jgi:hypothetical protein
MADGSVVSASDNDSQISGGPGDQTTWPSSSLPNMMSNMEAAAPALILEAEANPKGTDIFVLDVGGKEVVSTCRSTLTIIPNSIFAEQFNGNWDSNIRKDMEGRYHVFIDREPELFLPFLRFLRDLSSMTAPDYQVTPPMTPSFANPVEETAFRRMVDGYGLTNALYSYELYKFGPTIPRWSCRTLLSADCSIMNTTLEVKSGVGSTFLSLDRPAGALGDCHGRKVKSFEISVGLNCKFQVGWIRRCIVFKNDVATLDSETREIMLCSKGNKLVFKDQQGNAISRALTGQGANENSRIRCIKRSDTGDLEWHLDDVLVVATCKGISYGRSIRSLDGRTKLVGWDAPDDFEMVPYMVVCAGSCRFTDVELET